MISCVDQVDGSRCLLGDESKGHILKLFVDNDEKVESSSGSGCGFIGLKLELLGECSIPHCLAYLNNEVMFVGSRLGDSQLVKVDTCTYMYNSFPTVCHSVIHICPLMHILYGNTSS